MVDDMLAKNICGSTDESIRRGTLTTGRTYVVSEMFKARDISDDARGMFFDCMQSNHLVFKVV